MQNLYPELKELEIMNDDSKEPNCTLYGQQKHWNWKMHPSKQLVIKTLVVIHRFKYCMSFHHLRGNIREEGGIGLVDTLRSGVQQHIRDTPECPWQAMAEDLSLQAWQEYLETVAYFDLSTPTSGSWPSRSSL